MEITAEIFTALGLSDDADEAAVLTAAKALKDTSELSLEERAKAEGKVLFTQAEADAAEAAKTDAQKAAERIAKLEQKDAERSFHAIFDQGVKDLKLAPADEEDLRELFNVRGEDKFSEYVERQTPIVNGTPSGARGDDADPGDAPEGVDPEAYALQHKVETYMREHDDVDYMTALAKVRSQQKVEA